jgi:surface protein
MGRFVDVATLLVARNEWCADRTTAAAKYGPIGAWDVSAMTDLSYVFCAFTASYWTHHRCNPACSSFNDDLRNWDTARVLTMEATFYYASAFNQPLNWNTSRVTNMQGIFFNTDALSECNKAKLHATFSTSSAWACSGSGCGNYGAWHTFTCPSPPTPPPPAPSPSLPLLSPPVPPPSTPHPQEWFAYEKRLWTLVAFIIAVSTLAVALRVYRDTMRLWRALSFARQVAPRRVGQRTPIRRRLTQRLRIPIGLFGLHRLRQPRMARV